MQRKVEKMFSLSKPLQQNLPSLNFKFATLVENEFIISFLSTRKYTAFSFQERTRFVIFTCNYLNDGNKNNKHNKNICFGLM